MTVPRKYQPLWDKLKVSDSHSCTVQVHKLITSTVVKAVIKEKNQDVAFKMANERNPVRLVVKTSLLSDKKHNRIEFKLVSLGLDDIKLEPEL